MQGEVMKSPEVGDLKFQMDAQTFFDIQKFILFLVSNRPHTVGSKLLLFFDFFG